MIVKCKTPVINNIQFPSRFLGDNTSNKYLDSNPKCCLCYQWKTFNGPRVCAKAKIWRLSLLLVCKIVLEVSEVKISLRMILFITFYLDICHILDDIHSGSLAVSLNV